MGRTTHKRVSREESRARTRARLLEAAESLFVERGFEGTSVEEIAERAGYTRGAFYSNFEDKDDVFMAVRDDYLTRRIEEVGQILHQSSSLDAAFDLIKRGNESREINNWSILQAEFWLYAMRNPRARRKLVEYQRAEIAAYERAVKAQFEALGLELPAPLQDMALVLQMLDEGSPRQRMTDPEMVRKNFFFDAVLMLFEAAVALAHDRAKKSNRAPKA